MLQAIQRRPFVAAGVCFLFSLGGLGAHEWGFAALLAVLGAGLLVWGRENQRRTVAAFEERVRRATAEREEFSRRWREMELPPGNCTVALTAVKAEYPSGLLAFLYVIAQNPAIEIDDPARLVQRVAHIGPQAILYDVREDEAIAVKVALEQNGAKASISEKRVPAAGRETIPERVKNEVWRRDEARCRECGSPDRLEFDHIIPVSKGGSNTARNLQLLCETCNRKKAARI